MAQLGNDLYRMIWGSIEQGAFHKRITKGIVSLILKEGNSKNLNNSQPITSLIVIYQVFAKTF